jgi:hypothetical protein
MPNSFTKSARLNASYIAAVLVIILFSGCQVGSRPRLRRSDFFGNPMGMRFPDSNDLGRHCLDNCHGEKLGLVYTCRAGFIDLGHLREAADRTHYLSQLIYKNLMASNTNFTYRIIEPSYYHITFGYPDYWKSLPQQEKETVSREISIQLGQYLAHTSLIWHEILTWYGFSSFGVFSENISAFSLEDPYSDVLGTHLGAKVLSQPNCFYNESIYEEAMTIQIYETLEELDAQPPETAKQALEKIKGDWYEGGYYFFVEMKKRNLDVGLDDEFVTPWRISGLCPDVPPQNCPAPNFGFLADYEFKIRVRLDPIEFEKRKIFSTIGLKSKDQIIPYIHFPLIMESIRNEAKKLNGNNVDTPER